MRASGAEQPLCRGANRLHALDPNAVYVLTDLDSPGTVEKIGRDSCSPVC